MMLRCAALYVHWRFRIACLLSSTMLMMRFSWSSTSLTAPVYFGNDVSARFGGSQVHQSCNTLRQRCRNVVHKSNILVNKAAVRLSGMLLLYEHFIEAGWCSSLFHYFLIIFFCKLAAFISSSAYSSSSSCKALWRGCSTRLVD